MYRPQFMYLYIILMGLVKYSSEDCELIHSVENMCARRNFDKTCLYFRNSNTYIAQCHYLYNLNDHNLQSHQYIYLSIFDSHFEEMTAGLFRGFAEIENLTIFDSNINNLKPGIFNGLNLFYLNLSQNSIQTISKGVFNAMYTLTSLDLSKNTIQEVENESFTGMNNLEELYLNDNGISEMPPLTNCAKLTTLDMSNNDIDKLDFLRNCLNMKVLNIAGNSIEDFDSGELSYVLSTLDISKNKINYIKSDALQNLSNLKELNLGQNPLFNETNIPIDLFRNLASLKTLNLSCTSLKKFSVGLFSGLAELESLDLSLNNLTYLPKGIFHDLTSLHHLYINNNQLTHFEYDGFSTLQKINLDGNAWSCSALSAITKSLKRTEIIRGTANNTTNLFGIPCHEETKDFPNLAELNSTNSIGLDKDYISDIVSKALAELATLLNQTISNRKDRMESKLLETFENLKNFLKEEDSYQKNYSEMFRKTLETYQSSMQNPKCNVEEIIGKIGDAIALTQNKTGSDIKQMILDIKYILSSSKTISQPLVGDERYATNTEQLKIQEGSSLGQSATVALYCILVILCAIFVLSLSKHLKKFKRSRNSCSECNPLSTLQV